MRLFKDPLDDPKLSYVKDSVLGVKDGKPIVARSDPTMTELFELPALIVHGEFARIHIFPPRATPPSPQHARADARGRARRPPTCARRYPPRPRNARGQARAWHAGQARRCAWLLSAGAGDGRGGGATAIPPPSPCDIPFFADRQGKMVLFETGLPAQTTFLENLQKPCQKKLFELLCK